MGKKVGEEKKAMAALLVFMLTSLEIFLKEKDCLRGELYFGFKVIKKSSSNIYIFLTLTGNRNSDENGYILKANV